MKHESNNHQDAKSSGCLPTSAGCLTSALLFPLTSALSFGLAFAVGPMNCAHPNYCSQAEQNAKGIVSSVIFLAGGFGAPIATGIWVRKIAKSSLNQNVSAKDKES
jgi:hypothetical protein